MILQMRARGRGGRRGCDLPALARPARAPARIGGVLSLQCRRRAGAGLRQCARALTLGVEAVLADGRLYQGLNSLKKDNTGYDLQGPPDRGRGDARHHHGRDAEALPAAARPYETAFVLASPRPAAALELLHTSLRERTGSRLHARSN